MGSRTGGASGSRYHRDASFPPLQPQPTLLRRLSLTAAALDGPFSVFACLRAAVDARRSDVAALLDATLTAARGSDDARATLLPHVLRDALTAVAGPGPHPDGGALEELLNVCQEAVVVSPCVGIALRPTAGRWVYVRLCSATLRCDELTTAEYLSMKETLVSGFVKGGCCVVARFLSTQNVPSPPTHRPANTSPQKNKPLASSRSTCPPLPGACHF